MPSTMKVEIFQWTEKLSAAEYVSGLLGIAQRMNAIQRRLLTAQYAAPHRSVTSPQLAAFANVDGGFPVVNVQYGRLGRMFLEQTGNHPNLREDGTDRLWATWSIGYKIPEGWVWEMLPAVAEALELLGWVSSDEVHLTEEITVSGRFPEGAVSKAMVNAYERNRVARQKCIDHYGAVCVVCGFNFAARYGSSFDGFIHVHHLQLLSEIGEEYEVDPIVDLRPVCPNCHAVIHWGGGLRSIEETKRLLQ